MGLEAVLRQLVPASEASLARCHSGPVLHVAPASILDVLRFLRDDPAQSYDMLVDVTAVDHCADEGCLHVVYQLRSFTRGKRLMVKVKLDPAEPRLASATPLWKSADWAEREVWDMFGVRFEGHPNLRRILLYEQFEGHPLRKDYPVDKRQPLIEERDPIKNPWPSRDSR